MSPITLPASSLRDRSAGKFSNITVSIYTEISKKMLNAINGQGYFAGSIEYDTDAFCCTLRCTLVIYRQLIEEPTGDAPKITDIVPVWWEFEMYDTRQQKMVTSNFSFKKLKKYLID